MKLPLNRATKRTTRGYTLLELLISLTILTVITGAVFKQINLMQKKSSSEASKLDLDQQAREFMDQTVHDLHMSGYPGVNMYSTQQYPSMVAAGLVSISPAQILMEGDVNNDGTVYSVTTGYVANDPLDPNCPCIRRSAQKKIDMDSFSQGTNPQYTETQHVFPPGTGAGQSGEDLFAYFDQNGNPVDLTTGADVSTPQGAANLAKIKTVKINLSLSQRDAESHGYGRTSMSATSRLNN